MRKHGTCWSAVPGSGAGSLGCRVGIGHGESLCSDLMDTGLQGARVPCVQALPQQKSRKGLLHVHKATAIPVGSKENTLTQQDEVGCRAAAPQIQFGATSSSPSELSSQLRRLALRRAA